MKKLAQAKLAGKPEFQIKPPTWWNYFAGWYNYSENINKLIRIGEDIFAKPIRIINDRIPNDSLAQTVYLGDKYYAMGVGGLHSVDGAGALEPFKDQQMTDIDVVSYYPNIMLTQKLEPSFWNGQFLPIYQSIVERRIKAKGEGDTTTAAVLKIVANGSFGKFGDKYSALYDQEMLAHVTVYGQLGLLVLIAMLTDAGHQVVSANTDGVTVISDGVPEGQQYSHVPVVEEWEKMTGLTMEYTEYQGQYQLDVNNYIALTAAGRLKTKGRFLSKRDDLRHMPSALIIAKAIGLEISEKIFPDVTIQEEPDLHMFLFCAAVNRDWKVTFGDQPIGKIIRFYKSTRKDLPQIIRTPTSDDVKGNAGQVPDSENCVPVENLPDTIPEDLDYDWYIAKAYEILHKIQQPKLEGMNAEAERLVGMGLEPTVVDSGSLSRANVKYGTTDFNSINPHQTLAVRTGNGIIGEMTDGMTTRLYKTVQRYPSRTRDKVEADQGFKLIYGASVPVPPWGVDLDEGYNFDCWYTPAELKKVRGDI
jgi:hypothetical protein